GPGAAPRAGAGAQRPARAPRVPRARPAPPAADSLAAAQLLPQQVAGKADLEDVREALRSDALLRGPARHRPGTPGAAAAAGRVEQPHGRGDRAARLSAAPGRAAGDLPEARRSEGAR